MIVQMEWNEHVETCMKYEIIQCHDFKSITQNFPSIVRKFFPRLVYIIDDIVFGDIYYSFCLIRIRVSI